MVRLFRDESGNITAPLLVFVGGFSLLLAHNEMRNINNRIDQVRGESQKNFTTQQNVSSLQMAARLLVGDSANNAAPIRLDPYIQNGPCDQGRKLTAANGGNWQSTADSITIQSYTQTRLQKNGEDIFNHLSQGQAPNLNADVNTPLRILGWKCSDTHAFLMEGVYVEAAMAAANASEKVSKTKALLAMAAPPPSTCQFYGKDATGKIYPDNKQPAGNEITILVDTLDLYLECNNVVTDAAILNGGVKLAGTNSYPLTAANRIDPAFKPLLGPVALAAGDHALQALVEQVDGSKIALDMTLKLGAKKDPATCASKCTTLPDTTYPNLCDSSMVHKDYYQSKDPSKWVCYKCEKYWGFDPDKNCEMTQVGVRTSEGCFADDTQIQLEDGRTVSVSALRDGDRIWNPLLGKGQAIHHVVAGPESLPLYRIVQNGDVLRVTQAHPFLTPLGIVAAKDLRVGDFIPGKDGGWTPVQAVTREAQGYGRKVWNFEIVSDSPTEEAHMLVANGIVTGDLYLQTRSISRGLLEMISMERKAEHD